VEPSGRLESLSLLQFHHHAQRFSGLVWSEFVQQMVNVDEEQIQVVHLLGAPRRLWVLRQQIEQVQEIDQQGVIQLA